MFSKNVLGAREGITGKPVEVRRGPATVIRKIFSQATRALSGKAKSLEPAIWFCL
jgi:hypothetical protein